MYLSANCRGDLHEHFGIRHYEHWKCGTYGCDCICHEPEALGPLVLEECPRCHEVRDYLSPAIGYPMPFGRFQTTPVCGACFREVGTHKPYTKV